MGLFRARTDLQRTREGATAVTQIELFFDLVFVFATTQLSHLLLSHLDWLGAAQTALLFCAVWWAWIYTSWVTNWLEPERVAVRLLLLALMAAGLVLSAALPLAFGTRGLAFALAYAAMQIGRSLFMLWALAGRNRANMRNFQRILVWLVASGVLWIAGGANAGALRLLLWASAVAVEFAGPATGYRTPGLGHSTTQDWDVDAQHMAERCSAFVLIALGESLTVTGAAFFEARWTPAVMAAFACALVGAVALWWIYFDSAAERTARLFAKADDTGALARVAYTYLHALLVAGIVVSAVADELVLARPGDAMDTTGLVVLIGGPGLYLLGNGLFRRALSPRFPPSHVAGLAGLAAVGTGSFAWGFPRLAAGAAVAAVLVATAAIGAILQARLDARRPAAA